MQNRSMNEEKRKRLEQEIRKEKLKRFLFIGIGLVAFTAAMVFILYGKVGHL